MKIKVKDKSTGATKIAVRRVKPIWVMSVDDIIKKLDLKNKILDWHYQVENRYHEVSDIYSDELVEYVAEELYDYCQEPEYEDLGELATKIIAKLEDELVEQIYDFDDLAKEDYEVREEARTGRY